MAGVAQADHAQRDASRRRPGITAGIDDNRLKFRNAADIEEVTGAACMGTTLCPRRNLGLTAVSARNSIAASGRSGRTYSKREAFIANCGFYLTRPGRDR